MPSEPTPGEVIERTLMRSWRIDSRDKTNEIMSALTAAGFRITRDAPVGVTIPLDVAKLVDSALWFGVHDVRWSEAEKWVRYEAGCRLQAAIAAAAEPGDYQKEEN